MGQAKPLPATALGLPAQPSLDVSTGSRQRPERMEGSLDDWGSARHTARAATLACLVLEETEIPQDLKDTTHIYEHLLCARHTTSPPSRNRHRFWQQHHHTPFSPQLNSFCFPSPTLLGTNPVQM